MGIGAKLAADFNGRNFFGARNSPSLWEGRRRGTSLRGGVKESRSLPLYWSVVFNADRAALRGLTHTADSVFFRYRTRDRFIHDWRRTCECPYPKARSSPSTLPGGEGEADACRTRGKGLRVLALARCSEYAFLLISRFGASHGSYGPSNIHAACANLNCE